MPLPKDGSEPRELWREREREREVVDGGSLGEMLPLLRREVNKMVEPLTNGPGRACHMKVGVLKLGLLLELGAKSTAPKSWRNPYSAK